MLYDYTATPEVMRLVKEYDLTIIAQDYQERCRLDAEVRVKTANALRDRVTLLAALGTGIALGD